MKHIRLSIIGFGVVGQGLAELLTTKQALLRRDFGLEVTLISVANARHGFIYREDGLDIPTLLELAAARRPLTEHPGIQHWAHPLDGLQATGGDVLAEATGTNLRDAEPGMSTIREGMAGTSVSAIRGILNGTTNYILSAMSTGRDYREVLAEAQALGFAEADPTADV